MIKYSLSCSKSHRFEAWFRSSEAFDRQRQRALVHCPECGDTQIDRAPMAPAIMKRERGERASITAPEPSGDTMTHPVEVLRAMKRYVLQNAEDVGSRFAEEARKIHSGEAEQRSIHGKTTAAEARELAEDGVSFAVLPVLPEDNN